MVRGRGIFSHLLLRSPLALSSLLPLVLLFVALGRVSPALPISATAASRYLPLLQRISQGALGVVEPQLPVGSVRRRRRVRGGVPAGGGVKRVGTSIVGV